MKFFLILATSVMIYSVSCDYASGGGGGGYSGGAGGGEPAAPAAPPAEAAPVPEPAPAPAPATEPAPASETALAADAGGYAAAAPAVGGSYPAKKRRVARAYAEGGSAKKQVEKYKGRL